MTSDGPGQAVRKHHPSISPEDVDVRTLDMAAGELFYAETSFCRRLREATSGERG